ncbi:SdrD B-like domain-containing protein, partial [Sporichthya sp.]|uniref:SdrD B-like domain-containing protein n=1 Tax=Sporichthya sp. TaxID=65475 RepID=UPI0017A3DAF1
PALSAIGGRIFLDADGDTVDDPEEAGVAEATVRIFGTSAAGTAVDLTVPTDAAGRFALLDLAPGTYSVAVSALPAGLLPLGVLAPAGWLLGLDRVEAVELAPGATLIVGFIAGPAV